jgi:hypothetical protein
LQSRALHRKVQRLRKQRLSAFCFLYLFNFPLPLVGRGQGWGWRGKTSTSVVYLSTPLPTLPHKGGGSEGYPRPIVMNPALHGRVDLTKIGIAAMVV